MVVQPGRPQQANRPIINETVIATRDALRIRIIGGPLAEWRISQELLAGYRLALTMPNTIRGGDTVHRSACGVSHTGSIPLYGYEATGTTTGE